MPELIWDGKYDEQGRKVAPLKVPLPFQTVETVNESAADRERMRDLFTSGRRTEWRNRLIWGDKKYVLPSLLPEFAGKVNLIYIDPPFATGADFSFTARIPDNPETEEDESAEFVKQPSMIEMKAYRDTWGKGLDSYLKWFYETAVILHELLADKGSIYVHIGTNVSHYVKLILDEVFLYPQYRSEIVWRRSNSHNKLTDQYGPIHDVILFFTKGDEFSFHPGTTPFSKGYIESRFKYKDKRGIYQPNYLTGPGLRMGDSGKPWHGFNPSNSGRHWAIPSRLTELLGKDIAGMTLHEILDELLIADLLVIPKKLNGQPMYKQYITEGVPYQDVWAYQPNSKGILYGTDACLDEDVKWLEQEKEKANYDTQKPEGLIKRIIESSSSEGDLVADLFCGSGTTAAVAEKMGRRWIAADLGRFAIHTTRKRLLQIPDVKPFIVQNLGRYERQVWQAAEFGEENAKRQLAYRKFILDLYHATELPGFLWLHGVKAGRMVHVASVDSPVTESDLANIAAEFKKAMGSGGEAPRTNGVDVLGWDFAFEVNEVAKERAELAGLDVRLKNIPMEVMDKRAADQGDVKFFELAALEVVAKLAAPKKLAVQISNFIMPQCDIPEEVRGKISHWSQWIDYWAIDWDYKDDTFHNQWQSYRTRKDNTLLLNAEYKYEKSGKYRVLIKVVDILGNDTTKMVSVEVK